MPERFETLIAEHEDSITRAWADRIYADPRTGLSTVLSYEQLVDPLPDLLTEMARALDLVASEQELAEMARRLRAYAQVRFYQGVLIDEVARELMIFRQVFEDFLWREARPATSEDLRRLRSALRRANGFVDEMLVQAVLIYAVSLRPPVETRGSVWPPPLRRRRTNWPHTGDGDR